MTMLLLELNGQWELPGYRVRAESSSLRDSIFWTFGQHVLTPTNSVRIDNSGGYYLKYS